ncbi:hypothetical protein ACO0R3_003955 [Hanseniaspora guilliermondii]
MNLHSNDNLYLHKNKNFKKLFKVILFVKVFFNIVLPLIVYDFPSTKGYFQPDEYYQTLNVSYLKFINKTSPENLTWEWNNKLRSYLFPFIIENLGYRLFNQIIPYVMQIYLSFVAEFMIFIGMYWNSGFIYQCVIYVNYLKEYAPKAFSASFGITYGPIFAMCLMNSYIDYYTICFFYKVYSLCNEHTKRVDKTDSNNFIKLSFLLITANFFNVFFQNRFFINSFERGLNVIGLYFFNWENNSINYKYYIISLTLGFLSICQRPTNAFIWGTIGSFKVLTDFRRTALNLKFYFTLVISMMVSLIITLSTDFYFYKEITFPMWSFIQFNYSKNLSKFYGSSPFNFHFVQSIPILCGLSLPLYLISLSKFFKSPNVVKILHITIILNTTLFSIINHKEFRFLYPAQPLFLCLSTIEYMSLIDKRNKSMLSKLIKKIPSFILQGLCVISFFSGLLISYFNEKGVVEVCNYLNDNNNVYSSVSFLMPCHSIPGISYMTEYNNRKWELTCEPPLFLLDEEDADIVEKSLESYLDESDIFYLDPRKWISENMSDDPDDNHNWTDCIVMFQILGDDIYDDILKPKGYILEKKWFNTIQHWDHRRQGDVQLFCKKLV